MSEAAIRLRAGAWLLAAVSAWVSGCTAMRGENRVGAYVDDATITTSVMARIVEDKNVDASAIKVETTNGTVMLSGYARSTIEKTTAESIAMKVKGAKIVRNEIAVRP